VNEPDLESGSGQYPLELALHLGEMGMARILVEHGANVNSVDAEGSTFLWKALQKGKV
jgi:ankyrin repeat protein